MNAGQNGDGGPSNEMKFAIPFDQESRHFALAYQAIITVPESRWKW